MATKIVIIENDEILKDGLSLLIKSMTDHSVVGAYISCEEAIKNLDKDNPEIILMDIDLAGMNGIEGIQRIKKIREDINIIVVTGHEDCDSVFEAFGAGASGYITRNSSHTNFLDAIEEVSTGGAPMSSNIARMVVESFHKNQNSPLTPRETEVLVLLAKGKSYSVIAEDLFIHKETVKSHIKNIYFKLHVNSKADALEVARKYKLI